VLFVEHGKGHGFELYRLATASTSHQSGIPAATQLNKGSQLTEVL
jgi:hypothetical protein